MRRAHSLRTLKTAVGERLTCLTTGALRDRSTGTTRPAALAASIFHDVPGSSHYTNFYYAKNTAGGTTSLTLNFSGGSTYLLVAVAEVAGLSPSGPLDQSAYHESLTATTAWSSAAATALEGLRARLSRWERIVLKLS